MKYKRLQANWTDINHFRIGLAFNKVRLAVYLGAFTVRYYRKQTGRYTYDPGDMFWVQHYGVPNFADTDKRFDRWDIMIGNFRRSYVGWKRFL